MLLIEDEDCVGQALTLLLEQHGYRVVRCFDGLDAVERLRAGAKPDLILLDLVTPRMDGWEFRVAQRREPAWADIPVVALSADGSAKALAIDVAAFLRKPVEGAELLATLDQVWPTRQAGSARRADDAAVGAHDGLANPIYFALDCLVAAREHGHRLDNELAGLSRARSIALGRLLEGAHRSVEALVGALQASSPFVPKSSAAHPVDLRELLERAVELVGPELPPGTRVKRGFMPVPAVQGDPVELGQVFLNLLRNAARALRGQPSPEVAIELFPDARDQVFVTISDNGCGVSAELEERLFEPFCTTSRARAAGLGLTVARQLIERQGGRVEYESIEGLGSSFVVSLRAQPRRQQEGPAPESRMERKLLGLLVKQPQLAGGVLARALSFHLNLESLSGAQALARLADGAHYDLVLCHVDMARPTIAEFSADLRRVRPDQAARLVVAHGPDLDEQAKRLLDALGIWRLDQGQHAGELANNLLALLQLWQALRLPGLPAGG